MKFNNNFNLIRLFAALQVAITPSASFLDINLQFLQILDLFPGVPIFFFFNNDFAFTQNGQKFVV